MIQGEDVEKIIAVRFAGCLKSLEEISGGICKDPKNRLYYSYDCIEESDCKAYCLERLHTPDLILFKKKGIIFVEFKGGKVENISWNEVKLKAIEGGFVILNEIVSRMKNDLKPQDIFNLNKYFILVYSTGDREIEFIKHHIKKLEGVITRYKKPFFKDVFVISCEVFEEKFVKNNKG
jgi:hypothetical protein